MDGHIFLYSHVWQDIKASKSPKFDPDSPSADDQVPIIPIRTPSGWKTAPKNDAEISTYIPTEVRLDPSMNLYPDLLRVNPTFMVNL